MKQIIVGLIFASLPHWLSNAVADTPTAAATEQETHVIKIECADGGTKTFEWTSDGQLPGDCQLTGNGNASSFVWVSATSDSDGETDDGRSEGKATRKRVMVFTHEDSEASESGGWLGISIGGVPSVMAQELEIENAGVLILKVIDDSPADLAGIRDQDIVLSIDSGDAITDSSALVKAISGKSPGDVITVELLRGGQTQTLTVELGSRADMPKRQRVILRAMPFGRLDENVKVRGKMLRRGDDNEWIFEDLGDIADLKMLPDHLRMFIPKQSDRSTTVNINDGKTIVETRINTDGEVLSVEQVDDGEITVRRTDQDGNETVEVYADKDELREADKEAYDAIDRANVFQLKFVSETFEGLADIDLDLPDFDFDFHTGAFAEHAKAFTIQLQDHLGNAEEIHKNALSHLEEVLAHLNGNSDGDEGGHVFLMDLLKNTKPKYSFRELDDGQIEVHIRKGDSEIVKSFSDENDLADRSPKLFDRYQALLDGEE